MPTSFHDERFPTGISRKASGGPERRTEIVTLSSGHEQRNTRWADSRRRYSIGYGIRSLDDLHTVITFFEQRRGRLYGFRWKDHADYKSSEPSKQPHMQDQQIGLGDGGQNTYRLAKTYGTGPNSYRREITKPVPGTVLVAINGSMQTEGSDYTLDAGSGDIVFATPPAIGEAITAGFQFDVPVRFDTDNIEISLDAFNAGQIPDIAILEIKQ